MKLLAYLSLFFLLPIKSVSASDVGLRSLRAILSRNIEQKICNCIKTWENHRPGLYDKTGKWTGKLVCGKTSAVCHLYLESNNIKSKRVVVKNLDYPYEDHSYIIATAKGEEYIIDPTVRQFGIETEGNRSFLIKNINLVKAWLNSQEKEILDPYWLCYKEGVYDLFPYGSYECFLPQQNMLSDMLKKDLDESQARYEDFILFKKQLLEDLDIGDY